MARFALVATALVASLLSLSTGVNAGCYTCPNCDYDRISNTVGDACLNYWTCSGNSFTCYYPSVEYPGTFSACQFTGTENAEGYYVSLTLWRENKLQYLHIRIVQDFTLTSGPSVCEAYIGDNPDCQGYNIPWNSATNECTAAEQYVGEVNSGLL
ncbi:hypothetical protein BU15DRAFT_66621 [Melanogaster broomeanus]|nr:hypothetical protein BU15DRAFT_66621 [Melanogaster broomeanus]